MDKSLLLPREQYEETAKRYGRSPYTFKIENDRQSLFYFGANHSRDPSDPQYPILKEYWNTFLKTTEGRERIVLVEGRLRTLLKDEEAAIKGGSEGGFITLLAHEANVAVACPDLSDEELVERLSDIPREETLLYWFLTFMNNFQRQASPKPHFATSAEAWCERQKPRKIWQGIEVSFSRMKELYEKIIGKAFDESENVNNFINPNKTETKINAVARAQSNLRDLNIASEIERYWHEGRSIFVVFGGGHLIIEEPALRKVLV
ncbi:MAG: hypothetical protein AAB608_01505 [Patescibacteria group bacterium]